MSLFGDGKSIFPNITIAPTIIIKTNDVLIRDTLGESIPPKFLETLLEFFEKIEKKKITFKIPKQQKFLFTQSLN